ITAFALVGVPPLSGFTGKLLLIQGGFESGMYVLGAIGLLSSLAVLYSLMNVFMHAFWGEEKDVHGDVDKPVIRKADSAAASALLLTAVIVIGAGSEWVYGLAAQ